MSFIIENIGNTTTHVTIEHHSEQPPGFPSLRNEFTKSISREQNMFYDFFVCISAYFCVSYNYRMYNRARVQM